MADYAGHMNYSIWTYSIIPKPVTDEDYICLLNVPGQNIHQEQWHGSQLCKMKTKKIHQCTVVDDNTLFSVSLSTWQDGSDNDDYNFKKIHFNENIIIFERYFTETWSFDALFVVILIKMLTH